MLIKSQEHQKQLEIVAHKNCAGCEKLLDYPRIVLEGKAHESYHILCALQVASSIIEDTMIFFNEEQFGELAKRIEMQRLFSKRPYDIH